MVGLVSLSMYQAQHGNRHGYMPPFEIHVPLKEGTTLLVCLVTLALVERI